VTARRPKPRREWSRRLVQLNQPPAGENWVWVTREMLESFASRALSANARLVINRVALEHLVHAGTANGELPVTYADFAQYGLRRSSILPAIAEAVALGFVCRTQEGQRAWGGYQGSPAKYRLTWLPLFNGTPATNEWKRFKSLAAGRKTGSAPG
jgi:hypothetical protein